MVATQFEARGEVDTALLLVTAFQTWYVIDAFMSEVILRLQRVCVCVCVCVCVETVPVECDQAVRGVH